MPVSEKPTVANSGVPGPVDIRLRYAGSGWLVEYDMGEGLTLSEYKRFKQAANQLRHSLGGVGRLYMRNDTEACHRLAERVGFKKKGRSFTGVVYEWDADA